MKFELWLLNILYYYRIKFHDNRSKLSGLNRTSKSKIEIWKSGKINFLVVTMPKYGKNDLTMTQKLMMEWLVNYKKNFSSWFAFLALPKKKQKRCCHPKTGEKSWFLAVFVRFLNNSCSQASKPIRVKPPRKVWKFSEDFDFFWIFGFCPFFDIWHTITWRVNFGCANTTIYYGL